MTDADGREHAVRLGTEAGCRHARDHGRDDWDASDLEVAEDVTRAALAQDDDLPDLEHVKHGVLECPKCGHIARGTIGRPCPTCRRRAEEEDA